jgi:hypothetical protein
MPHFSSKKAHGAAQIAVVFHQKDDAILHRRARRGRWAGAFGQRHAIGQRHLHHEAGAAPDVGGQAQGMAQKRAGAFHDGKAQPHPFGGRGTGIQAVEFLEDVVLFLFRYPRPGVAHLDPDHAAAPPHAHQHAAPVGVADRIADQVLQDAAQIGRHPR